MSDKELLLAFRKQPSIQTFQPFLDRYLGFVYEIALRQTGEEGMAVALTEGVFQAFAFRARKLSRKTVVASWLFRATYLAGLRVEKLRKRNTPGMPVPPVGSLVSPMGESDRAFVLLLHKGLHKLKDKYRDPVILRLFLGQEWAEVAGSLRTKETQVQKRFSKGLGELLRRLRKKVPGLDPEGLQTRMSFRPRLLPEGLAVSIGSSVLAAFREKPKQPMARATLEALASFKWGRRLKGLATFAAIVILFLATAAATLAYLWQKGTLLVWLMEQGSRSLPKEFPELKDPARPWPQKDGALLASAAAVKNPGDLYRLTNVWSASLAFSATQWEGIEPRHIPPVRNLMENGEIKLRNTNASRNGLAGAVGYDFNWVEADFTFGGKEFPKVASRYRGNGTYLNSLYGLKHSFKVDLNKYSKEQNLGGVHTLNFLNEVEDSSYMSDALGYELFRDNGVPAPRTAYAYLDVTVAGKWEKKPIGLYLMVENVDAGFAAERFGSKKAPIFKPVTYELFKDLGDDWEAYAGIYDLKTKATDEQKKRVIEFARFVTSADDAEFARRLGEFLDLDEFSRFLSVIVILSNYDGFLTNGQNFYFYLDPRSNKFGFIPWDLDHSWGAFPFVGSAEEREQASIFHPWVQRHHRLLERVMAVEEFKTLYRARMADLLANTFIPERLNKRIDAVAPIIRDAVSAESQFRLRRFDKAISTNWLDGPRDGDPVWAKRPVHQLKRFIANRAQSVSDQLAGKSEGMVLGGFGGGNRPRKPKQ